MLKTSCLLSALLTTIFVLQDDPVNETFDIQIKLFSLGWMCLRDGTYSWYILYFLLLRWQMHKTFGVNFFKGLNFHKNVNTIEGSETKCNTPRFLSLLKTKITSEVLILLMTHVELTTQFIMLNFFSLSLKIIISYFKIKIRLQK